MLNINGVNAAICLFSSIVCLHCMFTITAESVCKVNVSHQTPADWTMLSFGILSSGFHQDDCSLNMNSSSPVKRWRAQWGDLVCWFCPVTTHLHLSRISSWSFTIFHKFCVRTYAAAFPNAHVKTAPATFAWTECFQEASVWCWRDVNTPVSRNERSLGAAAATLRTGQCFHLGLYYSRLVEPRPHVRLLTCVGGPPTAEAQMKREAGEGPRWDFCITLIG